MIISLRGTNGAGKSTIVRMIMKEYQSVERLCCEGRKKPLGYVCKSRDSLSPGLYVPGHYEIQNGGIDTLPSLDEAYVMIHAADKKGLDVLYEGKNMSDGPARLIELRRLVRNPESVRVLLVSYPLEDCIAAVRQRGHSIQTKTIEKLYEKSFRDADALEAQGIHVERLPRYEALNKVKEWLKIT